MGSLPEFLARHGYAVLFALVVVERVGLPLPAVPILVAGGALVRLGRLELVPALLVVVAACLLADSVWFIFGRRHGGAVLRWICRLSLEPDSCVRRTERGFARWGAPALLLAKFVPPLSAAAMPMAGMLGMPPGRFLLFDTAGSALWGGVFLGVGFLLGDQVWSAVDAMQRAGLRAGVVLLGAAAVWVLGKYWNRRRFLRSLQVARITPRELFEMQRGGDVAVVDLRHSMERASDPGTIPGALHIPVEEFDARHREIPRGREIVLFCT